MPYLPPDARAAALARMGAEPAPSAATAVGPRAPASAMRSMAGRAFPGRRPGLPPGAQPQELAPEWVQRLSPAGRERARLARVEAMRLIQAGNPVLQARRHLLANGWPTTHADLFLRHLTNGHL